MQGKSVDECKLLLRAAAECSELMETFSHLFGLEHR